MGPMLASLLKLQSIENNMVHVRRRLRSKANAVRVVQDRIDELTARRAQLHDQGLLQQSQTDGRELDRKSREEESTRYQTALNTAKTNKEYSTILTRINTLKADNAKLEDEILKVMEAVDATKEEAEKVAAQVESEQKRLAKAVDSNAGEVGKLNKMLDDLQGQREQAATEIKPVVLQAFDRIAGAHEGEAMATIEITDEKRGEYSCGGCFMSLTAEDYNALLTKDEIRHCDSCARILYIATEGASNLT